MGIIDNNLIKMHLSRAAMIAASFIAPHEGMRTQAYNDPPGIHTICYGHTANVKMGQVETPQHCMILLAKDVQNAEKVFESETSEIVRSDLSPQTEAAFISFIFNTGAGTYLNSSVRRELNAGHVEVACEFLNKYVCARVGAGHGAPPKELCGSKDKSYIPLPGLVARREDEKELCIGGL